MALRNRLGTQPLCSAHLNFSLAKSSVATASMNTHPNSHTEGVDKGATTNIACLLHSPSASCEPPGLLIDIVSWITATHKLTKSPSRLLCRPLCRKRLFLTFLLLRSVLRFRICALLSLALLCCLALCQNSEKKTKLSAQRRWKDFTMSSPVCIVLVASCSNGC